MSKIILCVKFTIYSNKLSKFTTIYSKSEYLLIKKQSNESMGEKYFLRALFHWLIHYKIKAIIQI